MQPFLQDAIGISGEQDDPFFLTFTTHSQAGRLVGRGHTQQVIHFEVDHLADPQTCPEHQHKPGPVPRGPNDRPELFNVLIAQVSGYSFGLLTGVPFEANRVRPIQVTAFFGQKVEENFQTSHPSFDGGCAQTSLALVIDKGVNIVHCHFSPGFGTVGRKLTHIADIINRGASTRRSSL